jgi:hypothetical protein
MYIFLKNRTRGWIDRNKVIVNREMAKRRVTSTKVPGNEATIHAYMYMYFAIKWTSFSDYKLQVNDKYC